jgi:hypothetical protein
MRYAGPDQSVSTPIIAPVIWSMHFMTCYTWAALACGRLATADRFETARTAIVVATALAAIAIAACFAHGFRRHGRRLPDRSNDDGTPEDRTRFMAFMTMLLAALSLIATLYVGVAAAAMTRCS